MSDFREVKRMNDPDRLIAGPLLTGATREVLAARVAGARLPYTPTHFSPQEFVLLEQLSRLLVPHDPATFPLARSVDARLTRGDGDGWRYDELPPDADAYRMLLLALPEDFQAMQQGAQSEAVAQLQRQNPRVFEDLLAELTESYYAHPVNQLGIGYVGFADARGWNLTGLDQLDPHEQEALEQAGRQP